MARVLARKPSNWFLVLRVEPIVQLHVRSARLRSIIAFPSVIIALQRFVCVFGRIIDVLKRIEHGSHRVTRSAGHANASGTRSSEPLADLTLTP